MRGLSHPEKSGAQRRIHYCMAYRANPCEARIFPTNRTRHPVGSPGAKGNSTGMGARIAPHERRRRVLLGRRGPSSPPGPNSRRPAPLSVDWTAEVAAKHPDWRHAGVTRPLSAAQKGDSSGHRAGSIWRAACHFRSGGRALDPGAMSRRLASHPRITPR